MSAVAEVQGVFDDEPQIFARYAAEIQILSHIHGGCPSDPKAIEGWIRSKAGVKKEDEVRHMLVRTMRELGAKVNEDDAFEELVSASAKIADETHTNVFKTNGHGPYIESRHVKALLKESTAIGFPYPANKWGPTKKSPRAFLAEDVFIEPEQIVLGDDVDTDIKLWVGHPKTPQGRQSTLTYYEYADQPRIYFEVAVLDDAIKPDQWSRIWRIAQKEGLGALRSQGYGTFKLVRWERID